MVFVYGIGDVIIVAFLLIMGVILSIHGTKQYIKQSRCKHEHFRETMSCDAICKDCGKNLGFIGSVRDLRAARAALKGEKR
jgi:hypothetical protein